MEVLQPPPSQYTKASDLKRRGWTEALIRRHLGSADRQARNPHVPSAGKMRLYRNERIVEIEASGEFATALAEAARRGNLARQRIESERASCIEIAKSVQVLLDDIDLGECVAVAKQRVANLAPMFVQTDSAFVDIATVLAIEERKAGCYDALDEQFGRPGIREAREIVRRKIARAISARYPNLSMAVFDVLRGRR